MKRRFWLHETVALLLVTLTPNLSPSLCLALPLPQMRMVQQYMDLQGFIDRLEATLAQIFDSEHQREGLTLNEVVNSDRYLEVRRASATDPRFKHFLLDLYVSLDDTKHGLWAKTDTLVNQWAPLRRFQRIAWELCVASIFLALSVSNSCILGILSDWHALRRYIGEVFRCD